MSLAEVQRAMEMEVSAIETMDDPRDQWKDQTGFNIFSLGDWLKLCEEICIPHVPATKVAIIAVDTLMRYDIKRGDP